MESFVKLWEFFGDYPEFKTDNPEVKTDDPEFKTWSTEPRIPDKIFSHRQIDAQEHNDLISWPKVAKVSWVNAKTLQDQLTMRKLLRLPMCQR